MNMDFYRDIAITFVALFFLAPIAFGLLRFLGLYVVVQERQALVFTLFGKVIGMEQEAGLRILPLKLGWRAFLISTLGKTYKVDMRLDQEYLRSQAVNSEEGAPMGIGIWYEMFVSDPVAYLFKNVNPRGSLQANVSNATVRCLSNMPLENMLQDRHRMSRTVREEVSVKSHEWGYKLGSVYIRKVHFRDLDMVRQIETKVVNRLRQVTSAIKQDGINQVAIITSNAEKVAATEFARAAAMRPFIVGRTLNEIGKDVLILQMLFEILEIEKMLTGTKNITLIPSNQGMLKDLLISSSPDA